MFCCSSCFFLSLGVPTISVLLLKTGILSIISLAGFQICPNGGFQSHRGTPVHHHPFLDGIVFYYKPTILGIPMAMETWQKMASKHSNFGEKCPGAMTSLATFVARDVKAGTGDGETLGPGPRRKNSRTHGYSG